MSVSATARFTVTVDVPISTWNESENFARLRDVATKEGLPKLRAAMQGVNFKVVGAPRVITIMAADE